MQINTINMNFLENVKKVSKKKLILAILLIAFGVGGRIFRIHFMPDLYNVEPITLVALLAGSYLGLSYALIVPLSVVAISDVYIGNTSVLFFTWSAWAIIGLFSLILRGSKKDSLIFGFKMTGMGILSSMIFFIWTNFGVWMEWNMYAHTLSGLIKCYIMGIPFFKMNLLGNLVIISVVSFSLVLCLKLSKILLANKKNRKLIEKTGN